MVKLAEVVEKALLENLANMVVGFGTIMMVIVKSYTWFEDKKFSSRDVLIYMKCEKKVQNKNIHRKEVDDYGNMFRDYIYFMSIIYYYYYHYYLIISFILFKELCSAAKLIVKYSAS